GELQRRQLESERRSGGGLRLAGERHRVRLADPGDHRHPGGTTTAQVTLAPAAAILEPVVVTGYGTQRREAITGSVSTVSAAAANVGVITNVDQMIQARAAGVEVTRNNGEPGAGTHILIRGVSSISNSNDPLYVS